MLAATKDRFAFEIQRKALQLRQQELELVVQRYNNIAGLTSIAAGFAFDAMVELEIDHDAFHELEEWNLDWLEPLFYYAASLALGLAMYVVAIASFTVVFGHRLALLGGKTSSLDKAVAIMLKKHKQLFAASAFALFCLYVAAIAMVYLKIGVIAVINMCVIILFFSGTVFTLFLLNRKLTIEAPSLIHGDAHVHIGGMDVDLARLGVEGFFAPEASLAGSSAGDRDGSVLSNLFW